MSNKIVYETDWVGDFDSQWEFFCSDNYAVNGVYSEHSNTVNYFLKWFH